VGEAHETCTVVTFAVAEPLPFATVQVCEGVVGWVRMVTSKGLALAIAVAKVKAPFALIVSLSPPLSCKTRPVPVRPATVPPMVKVEEDDGLPDPPELLAVLGDPVQPNMTIEAATIRSDLVRAFIFIFVFLLPHQVW
jgi:hypothetical protein